jgi:uncharacterized membrane protein YkvA (DUF1232 family)
VLRFLAMNELAEGFPRDELGALVRRLPNYGRLAWALARDPRVARSRRLAVLGAAAYVISPVDLVPGFIPLAGQLDDLLVALGAIRLALDGLKPEWRGERLAAAGLTQTQLDADIHATTAAVGWMARSAARVVGDVTWGVLGAGADLGDRVYRAGWDLSQRLRGRR